jgi:nitroreductase
MELSLEAIKKRVSVRSYDGASLVAKDAKAIEASFSEAVPGPFGRAPRFALVSREDSGIGKSAKIGTYGVIAGAPAFVVGAVAKGEFACVDFGYALEGIILRATELGLGTCWIGGVFDRGAILRILGAGKGEFAPAISPLGRAADGRSVRDQLIRRSAGSDGRKPSSELFFAADSGGEWTALEDQGDWSPVLEAVRLGPSASNKQPWRLILDRREGGKGRLHLVMQEDRLYNNMLGAVKLQELDMGIAMRHVEVAARDAGLAGSWRRLEAAPVAVVGSQRYVASWFPGGDIPDTKI